MEGTLVYWDEMMYVLRVGVDVQASEVREFDSILAFLIPETSWSLKFVEFQVHSCHYHLVTKSPISSITQVALLLGHY